ncbi:uncharacterized protein LTR77_008538 [Saxophila tyrrhenica]|uniref:Deoxyribonuclease NucA/NucB domain-containing protein n=1 Tax=Saxophila tyrrhenica TaxID=1690608 RepID=A0AAV9P4J3_9PEZI|nr:hypothetical protein LTR77_008538 [Saxophila tyrrhenica]
MTVKGFLGTLLPHHALAFPSILETRTNGSQVLEFDCAIISEVCANMCFGAYFLGIGVDLTLHNAILTRKRARRKAAGCAPRPNRCSVAKGAPPGVDCDEYPSASTDIQGSMKNRVNRCVPIERNSRQGTEISRFEALSRPGGCDFKTGFASPHLTSNFCSGEYELVSSAPPNNPANGVPSSAPLPSSASPSAGFSLNGVKLSEPL